MPYLFLVTLFLLPPAISIADEVAATLSVKQLTLDSALTVARHTIKSCREKGFQVGVTVVDRNGIVQIALRDSLAPPITLFVSEGKAKAAANLGRATADLKDRANSPIGRVPGLVISTGGMPIEAAGSLYGAVGVSGAPSGKIDEECAQAGIEAVLEDLEMAM